LRIYFARNSAGEETIRLDYALEIGSDQRYTPGKTQVLIFYSTADLDAQAQHLVNIACMIASLKPACVAIMAHDTVSLGVMQTYAAALRPYGIKAEVFRDLKPFYAWLRNVQEESLSPSLQL